MKELLLYLITISLLASPAIAGSNCFMAMENNKIISSPNQEKNSCKVRHTPCSTFKIAISLMGYNERILTDEIHPEWPFEEGYVDYVEAWKQPHDPTKWIKNSCVWYSQIITKKLGEKKFSDYVKKFNYGNRDISGDTGKNNGLTESWLGSSLEISPQEQIEFLQKLLYGNLPVSSKAHEMTRNILFIEEWPNGWKFYGKTGSCDSSDGSKQTGWLVGWIEKENRKIIFANYLEEEKSGDYSGGRKAKAQAREKLLSLIEGKK